MTDLSGTINGKTAIEIARYFGFTVEQVQDAIVKGEAETYQDVYSYVKEHS